MLLNRSSLRRRIVTLIMVFELGTSSIIRRGRSSSHYKSVSKDVTQIGQYESMIS